MDHEHHDHPANHDHHPSDPARHHGDGHAHTHGIVDPSIVSTTRGLWALKWSFIGLTATAALQVIVFFLSGSVGLLADTIHTGAAARRRLPEGPHEALATRRARPHRGFEFPPVSDIARPAA